MLMDKKLRDYIDYIEKASDEPSEELIEYHKVMTQQFQHERFIHFVVTLFYVRHYYQLENGTQKLEELTKKLFKR